MSDVQVSILQFYVKWNLLYDSDADPFSHTSACYSTTILSSLQMYKKQKWAKNTNNSQKYYFYNNTVH